MKTKMFAATAFGVVVGLGGMVAGDAWRHIQGGARPSAAAVPKPLTGFSVDPSWVQSGRPDFRNSETVRSPDGKVIGGLWSCEGPSTFQWTFSMDETVHLLEGQVDVEYLGNRFTLRPGTTATFQAGTKAIWHVPRHAMKAYTLQYPGRLVLLWRKWFPASSRDGHPIP